MKTIPTRYKNLLKILNSTSSVNVSEKQLMDGCSMSDVRIDSLDMVEFTLEVEDFIDNSIDEKKSMELVSRHDLSLLGMFDAYMDIMPEEGKNLIQGITSEALYQNNRDKVCIGLDFDGTVVRHEYPIIGKPLDLALDYILKWSKVANII